MLVRRRYCKDWYRAVTHYFVCDTPQDMTDTGQTVSAQNYQINFLFKCKLDYFLIFSAFSDYSFKFNIFLTFADKFFRDQMV